MMTHGILKHHLVDVGTVTLHLVEAGRGEPHIFLHGFPEFWYGWHKQIPFFAERGYHVIVPDQRGYTLSDKPKPIAAYHITPLSDDVLGLIEHFGYEQVTLVAHDWGVAVAWWFALRYPHRLKNLIILNSPHPRVFRSYLQENHWQQAKSLYMLGMQIPHLPEWLTSLNAWQLGQWAVEQTSQANAFTENDWEMYRAAWGQPGAMQGMMNWYRAVAQVKDSTRVKTSIVTTPTCILWGKQDPFFNWELARLSIEMCPNGRLHYLEHATHWLHHEEPDRMNQLVGVYS